MAQSSELSGPEVRSVWYRVAALYVCVGLIVCLPSKDYKTRYYHMVYSVIVKPSGVSNTALLSNRKTKPIANAPPFIGWKRQG
jgi:hypothetical protein